MKDVGETSFNNLLKDSEAEVRTAAIGQVPGNSNMIKQLINIFK